MSQLPRRVRRPRPLLKSMARYCAREAVSEPDAWALAARWAWDEVLLRMPPKPRRYRRLTTQ